MSNEKETTKLDSQFTPPPFSKFYTSTCVYIPVADWSFLYSDTKADTSSNHVIYTFPVNKIYKQIIKKNPIKMINKKKNFANTASFQLTKGREELIKIWCFPFLWKCDMKYMIPARKNCTEEKKNKGKSLTMYMSKDIKIYRSNFQLSCIFFS